MRGTFTTENTFLCIFKEFLFVMIKTEPNINLLSLEGDYIFVETARAIREHEKKNPTRRIIKLGIGDTSLPLP